MPHRKTYRTAGDKIAKLRVVETAKRVVAFDVGHVTQLQYVDELSPVQIHHTSLHIHYEAVDRFHWRSSPWFEARKLFRL